MMVDALKTALRDLKEGRIVDAKIWLSGTPLSVKDAMIDADNEGVRCILDGKGAALYVRISAIEAIETRADAGAAAGFLG